MQWWLVNGCQKFPALWFVSLFELVLQLGWCPCMKFDVKISQSFDILSITCKESDYPVNNH